MLEWIVVGLIVAAAALLLARSMYRAVNEQRPTCACGHLDCPLAGDCTHEQGPADELPQGCPLDSSHGDATRQPTRVP